MATVDINIIDYYFILNNKALFYSIPLYMCQCNSGTGKVISKSVDRI